MDAMCPGDEKPIELEGGAFTMGSDDALSYPGDGEEPREVVIDAFSITAHAVSTARFREFVEATSHHTAAERYGDRIL